MSDPVVVKNHHMDSTRWRQFEYRDGDIVIATWAKSGTTWMQQIVGQLVFRGDDNIPVMEVCPWLDYRLPEISKVVETLNAQTHRRFIKTHLPADALPFSDKAKYIFIGRDGRDALWSWFNHHHAYTDVVYESLNNAPNLVGPPLEKPADDVVAYFHEWLDRDGYPAWPFFSNILSWWEHRDDDNVLMLHFNDLQRDLQGNMRVIARFLGIEISEDEWPDLVAHCTFDYMKKNADRLMPHLKKRLHGGAQRFIYKGSNERWRDVLSTADIEKYESFAARALPADCATWLMGGKN